jgi:lactate dehydrogenase-like 2-hydroxyacid dehydrogenase
MKPKVLVTRELFDETLALLAQHCELSTNQEDIPFSPEVMKQKVADKDGVLSFSPDHVSAEVIAAAPRLRVIANCAVGFNNVDVAAASARKIMVTNTPGVLNDSTADLTWALLLSTARRIPERERFVRSGRWGGVRFIRDLALDVHHRTLGIIGMGRIGQVVARRALGFDMRVIYNDDVRLSPAQEAACNATYVGREELLRQADFVTVHVPYLPETHHLIGAKEIALMKQTAIVINAARGGVVDELALIEALKKRRLGGAGLDVFEGEPQVRPELLQLDNVVLAPHIGSATDETRRNMANLAARNLVAALRGERPPNLVNE